MSKSVAAPPGSRAFRELRETPFVEIIPMLARQWWLMLTIVLLAAGGAALYAMLATPVYESTALVLVDKGDRGALPFVDPAPNAPSTRMANELETLRSRAVAEAVARRLMARGYADSARRQPLEILAGRSEEEPVPAAEVARRLLNDVGITPVRESDILRIAARSPGRQEASLIVSTCLAAFNERRRELSLERTRAAWEFLEAQQKARRQALRENDSALQRYMRESTLNLEERYSEAAVESASEFADVVVLDPPSLPDEPVSPRKGLLLLCGLGVGLVLSAVVALMRAAVDRRIYSARDIRGLGCPLFAAVPRVPWLRKNATRRSAILEDGRWYDTSLISLFHPFDPATESFRRLLAVIRNDVRSAAPRRVMVTSANTQEGKTLVAANLAVTAAQLRTRVLLIDTDVHRPALHQLFNIVPSPGLSDYIKGTNRFDEVVRISVLENLDVICWGAAVENSGRTLTTWRLKEFLDRLAPAYDLFLFDTPPLQAWDPGFLCAFMDMALVVVRRGQTTGGQLERAVQMLRGAGTPVAGAVFNSADAVHSSAAPYRMSP